MKSNSQKRLDEAVAQVEEADQQLFNAKMNLGRIRYLLKKSKFPVPEPGPGIHGRVRHAIEVNGCEWIFRGLRNLNLNAN